MESATELMTPPYALVYTTYCWDDFTQSQYTRNVARSHSGEHHIVVDESKGAIETPPDLRKTVANHHIAKDLGLRIAYDRSLFWHNLDYLYYIFFHKHPEYEYYVFLDYDAFIDADIDDLIARVQAEGIDHVGQPVSEDVTEWVYSNQHTPIYGTQMQKGTLLPITVLSRAALSHLFHVRISMSRTLPVDSFWPLCEAFIANELKGFSRASLCKFGAVENYSWWPPSLDEALTTSTEPSFIHPVLDRDRYIASMVKHSPGFEFFCPTSRFWTSFLRHPGRDWVKPLFREAYRRAIRLIRSLLSIPSPSSLVSMTWTEETPRSRWREGAPRRDWLVTLLIGGTLIWFAALTGLLSE